METQNSAGSSFVTENKQIRNLGKIFLNNESESAFSFNQSINIDLLLKLINDGVIQVNNGWVNIKVTLLKKHLQFQNNQQRVSGSTKYSYNSQRSGNGYNNGGHSNSQNSYSNNNNSRSDYKNENNRNLNVRNSGSFVSSRSEQNYVPSEFGENYDHPF